MNSVILFQMPTPQKLLQRCQSLKERLLQSTRLHHITARALCSLMLLAIGFGAHTSGFAFAPIELPIPSPSPEADLIFSTFLGGEGEDFARAIAVDSTGAVYITGFTQSADFLSTPGAMMIGPLGGADVFIAKLSTFGTTLDYLTFIGGSLDDAPRDLAIDSSGAVYVTGQTASAEFPSTPGTYADEYIGGSNDVFVLKLHPSGSYLEYGTFLGSDSNTLGTEIGFAIAVDTSGSAYVAGRSGTSFFFPTTSGYDTSHNGGQDGFVARFDPTATSMIYGTYIGGDLDDQVSDLEIDGSGSAYITGITASTNIPDTDSSFQQDFGGGTEDAFIAKLSPDGSDMSYISYLGGSGTDFGLAIALDAGGSAYVTGRTDSNPFPTTTGSAQTSYGGGQDAYVVKVSASGDAIIYATYLGGASYDVGHEIAINADGSATIGGNTLSNPFITLPDGFQTSYGGGNDAFAARLDSEGDAFTYWTYLGGSLSEEAYGITLDQDGFAYLTGRTSSSNFPWTEGVYDPGHNGMNDAFVLMIGMPNAALPIAPGFLDLPIEYETFSDAAQSNLLGNNDPSRVNSWFDHTYPTYAGSPNWNNENLTRWDGRFFDFENDEWKRGLSWYDGHNGIDFSVSRYGVVTDDLIYAAAPGSVHDINDGCLAGQPCNYALGNFVWIDHGNCFSTRYGHLRTVTVTTGEAITNPSSQPLGIMGNTGGRSFGTHLHFDVLYDIDCDGDWSFDSRAPVDPYGWYGAGDDPWTRAHSDYLWTQALGQRMLVPVSGAYFDSPSSMLRATFPEGTFTVPTWVELWDAPITATPLWPLNSSGRSAWLRPHSSGADLTFLEPVSLEMAFDPTEWNRMDYNQAEIHAWNDDTGTWIPHATTINHSENIAQVQLTSTARVELLAPLFIPEDSAEPDDDFDSASPLPLDRTPLDRLFSDEEDEDWFSIHTFIGLNYEIVLSPQEGLDPILELVDRDGFTRIQTGDVSPYHLKFSYDLSGDLTIQWRAPTSGTYFLRVSPNPGSLTGVDATYEIYYTQEAMIFLPLILK